MSFTAARFRLIARFFLRCSALLTVLCMGVQGQQPESSPRPTSTDFSHSFKISDVIARLKSEEEFRVHDAEILVVTHAVEGIPVLKEQFLRRQDPLERAEIASALLRLGEKDDTYWQFLVRAATEVLNNDPPGIFRYDQNGRGVNQPNNNQLPELHEWGEAHNLSTEEAITYAYTKGPQFLVWLAVTGDPRGVPILRRSLLARDVFIQDVGAKGLAQIKDRDSAYDIVQACKSAPLDAAAIFARWLVYFDDPEAQAAFEHYVPKDVAKRLREKRAQGRGPFE